MSHSEQEAHKVSVPGRICLAGENIDWISGPVLTAALDSLRTTVQATSRTKQQVFVQYGQPYNTSDLFEIHKTYNYGRESTDYVKAVIATLYKSGYQIEGLNLDIQSNLPVSGGLASSGSFCVALVAAANLHFELGMDNEKIAETAFIAEKEEMGIGCGQMDQYAVALGGLLYLNCSTKPPEIQKLCTNEKVIVVIGDTGTSMRFSGVGEELKRRLDNQDPSLIEYVVRTEEAIQNARKLLAEQNWNVEEIGHIINQCHEYIKIHKGIYNPVIESFIEVAKKAGSYCAKTSGARSNGGCMFALCSPHDSEKVANSIIKAGGKASITSIANAGIIFND